jgi:hypothetical protein
MTLPAWAVIAALSVCTPAGSHNCTVTNYGVERSLCGKTGKVFGLHGEGEGRFVVKCRR